MISSPPYPCENNGLGADAFASEPALVASLPEPVPVSAHSGDGQAQDLFGTARKTASISPCGAYRYELTRRWDDGILLPIIMLNPSTADADVDDPTIRRCISFAKREGFGGIRVMNLFAYRATSPKDMLAVGDAAYGGLEQTRHLSDLILYARINKLPVLAAWGAHGVHGTAKWVQSLAEANRVTLVCLGKTNGGHPRHPLYVAGDQPFEPLTNGSAAL